jgi:hypothetical protein
MKYMLLIQQGSTPTPLDPEAWATLSSARPRERRCRTTLARGPRAGARLSHGDAVVRRLCARRCRCAGKIALLDRDSSSVRELGGAPKALQG